MNPIVTTTLKRLTSVLKSDVPAGRAGGASFGRWDRSHFERWTGSQAQPQPAALSEQPRMTAEMAAWDKKHFERWTRAQAGEAERRRRAGRAQADRLARQTYAMYYE